MSHLEIRLPETIRIGMTGGPVFATEVVTLNSGWEQRNILQDSPLRQYSIDYVNGLASLKQLHSFFLIVKGSAYSFRLKDYTDFEVSASEGVIGTGTGTAATTYQLYKRYAYDGNTDDRAITKLVAGSYSVFKDSVLQTGGGTHYTMNENTGVITWVSAPNGNVISWSGEFDVPVRFTLDQFSVRLIQHNLFEVVNLGLKEVRL